MINLQPIADTLMLINRIVLVVVWLLIIFLIYEKNYERLKKNERK